MKSLLAILVGLCMFLSCTENDKKSTGLKTGATYQLFPTTNMWTFIKLNTRNGKMWQVQYDVKGNNRGEYSLNPKTLVSPEQEDYGRFTLYPTQNMFTFILLDQQDGKMWQVQWSIDGDNRLVIPMQGKNTNAI